MSVSQATWLCLILCSVLQSVCPYCNLYSVMHCNTLQHTATHCNTLQHTATHCNTPNLRVPSLCVLTESVQCNALQHTATHCNTPNLRVHSLCVLTVICTAQCTATHCNTLQHTATHCNTLQHTATHCNTPNLRVQRNAVGSLLQWQRTPTFDPVCVSRQIPNLCCVALKGPQTVPESVFAQSVCAYGQLRSGPGMCELPYL